MQFRVCGVHDRFGYQGEADDAEGGEDRWTARWLMAGLLAATMLSTEAGAQVPPELIERLRSCAGIAGDLRIAATVDPDQTTLNTARKETLLLAVESTFAVPGVCRETLSRWR